MLPALLACEDSRNSSENTFKSDERILSYTQELVFSVDSLEKMQQIDYAKLNSSELSLDIDTVHYYKDKIYISCLRLASGCAKYQGDIKFVQDTLKLEMRLISDEVCTEQDAWRIRFVIDNRKGKKYIIRKYP
jgi:hypothetical protein